MSVIEGQYVDPDTGELSFPPVRTERDGRLSVVGQVEDDPSPRVWLPATVYGAPAPYRDFDGSQGTYAARGIISAGDSAANTKLAMTRFDIGAEDDRVEFEASLELGSGVAAVRLVVDPGDDDTAALWLSQGYPRVYVLQAGPSRRYKLPAAVGVVYCVPVLTPGATLANTKGRLNFAILKRASAKDFADAPLTHLYRLQGSGAQVRSVRAGYATQAITHSAASWDPSTGEWAGNGAAYGTLPAEFADAVSGLASGTILLLSLWARATSITSSKYYFGLGRATGGTGNKSGCLNLQQTGSGPIALNVRKGAANDNDHITNDHTLASSSSVSSAWKNFTWMYKLGELQDELSVFANGAFENAIQVGKPTGDLLYPYYLADAGGAVQGARLTSGGPTEPLAAGEYMKYLTIGRYPGMSDVDALAIIQSLYVHPGAYNERML